ncbi:MAG: hypothetical protein HY367_03595 [Candidatus Aenigmarchaeota archaeon]|nr:hypothetical protein [Candidatus Aenigmarchaeota archaeon]
MNPVRRYLVMTPQERRLCRIANGGYGVDLLDLRRMDYDSWCYLRAQEEEAKEEARYTPRSVGREKAEKSLQLELREPDYKTIAKNAGLEVLATTLEALFIPLMIGGVTVTCDNIRELKGCPYRIRQEATVLSQ